MTGEFLYSIQTKAALKINRLCYKGIHWVVCSEQFFYEDAPSSSPYQLYLDFSTIADSQDTATNHAEMHRTKLTKGAKKRTGERMASKPLDYIEKIIDRLKAHHYQPLLLVINRARIEKTPNRLKEIPLEEKPDVFSPEFRIEDLQEGEFDVLPLPIHVGRMR